MTKNCTDCSSKDILSISAKNKKNKSKSYKRRKAKEVYLLEKKIFGIFAEQKALAKLYAKKQTEYNTRLQEIRAKKGKLYEFVNYTSTLRDECASSFIACAYCFRRS